MKSTNTWLGSAILQYSGPRNSFTTLSNSLSNHSLSDVRVNLQTHKEYEYNKSSYNDNSFQNNNFMKLTTGVRM